VYLFTKLNNFFEIELISDTSDGCDTFSSSGLNFGDMDKVLIEVIELLSTLKIVKVRHMLKSSLINIIIFSYSYFFNLFSILFNKKIIKKIIL